MADHYYYAHGKLLITAEYFVLDGAQALAVPTRRGQSLAVDPHAHSGDYLEWTSYDADGGVWFSGQFALPFGKIITATDDEKAKRLQQLLRVVEELKPGTMANLAGFRVETRLQFPPEWGLGTSSTLVSNLARWLEVDPFLLLKKTFGGSGYDLACATAEGPILYRLQGEKPHFTEVNWWPPFRGNLYFVYLEEKQNSREGIRRYRKQGKDNGEAMAAINRITQDILQARELAAFDPLLREHERIVSEQIDLLPVQHRFFPDFWGVVKSLGAWGGDFALVTSTESEKDTKAYFAAKGYPTVINYEDMLR